MILLPLKRGKSVYILIIQFAENLMIIILPERVDVLCKSRDVTFRKKWALTYCSAVLCVRQLLRHLGGFRLFFKQIG